MFTKFPFAGVVILGILFLLMLWWDVNIVFLKNAEFYGRTTGFAYEAYLMIERVLGAVIFGGKFLGEAFLILGILTGLATIIWNLSRQAAICRHGPTGHCIARTPTPAPHWPVP